MSQSTTITVFVGLPLLGYLLGSIPFGLLIGFTRGVDVRKHGSGNIGSTNVVRALGRKWGYICFLLDVVKGLGPVLYAGNYLQRVFAVTEGESLPPAGQLAWLGVAAGCIVGHMFSVYLRFRGGKGVATSLGVVLGIWPYFTLTGIVTLAIWVGVWGMWRYVSLASIAAAVAFPVAFTLLIWRVPTWRFSQLLPLLVFSCLLTVLVIVRHRSNIARLLSGTELRGGSSRESRHDT